MRRLGTTYDAWVEDAMFTIQNVAALMTITLAVSTGTGVAASC